ncbi:unnamed protein product [Didymodactylos carnosus]|uniref:Uncharacterized protein n=1 Tax=Didymodactylos carnosus TaxID=1234261 RepID=A0A8S2HVX7_9BILA|nr:unnamed protein product [Didymodactylos carnosus]CAF3684608.1 unnamed protein product [Didymodactylos carnosus]
MGIYILDFVLDKRQVNGRISKDVHNLFYQSEKFNMKNYEDDAHDNTTLKNDENDDCFNGSPALYQESKFTVAEIVNISVEFFTTINLDNLNVICLKKIIKSVLSQPNLLPTT